MSWLALRLIVSPSDFNFISAETLSEGAFVQGHSLSAIVDELEEASIGDHGSVVDAVAVVHGADRAAAAGRRQVTVTSTVTASYYLRP